VKKLKLSFREVKPMYEVHSNYGCAIFSNENDAINALWLLGAYHNIEIDNEKVKTALSKKSFYEAFPLSIIKGE